MRTLLVLWFALVVSPLAFAARVGDPIGKIPVQDGGRIKPFETFAWESLQLIYGKKSFEGKTATEVVFTWLLIPEQWMKTPLIELTNPGVKEALKITGKDRYQTPESLFANERIPLITQELQTVRERGEKLNPYFQAVQRLESQLGLFHAIRTGIAIHVAPNPEGDKWISIADLQGPLKESFLEITKTFVDAISAATANSADAATAAKSIKNVQATPALEAAVDNFVQQAQASVPEKYADLNRIKVENHLNRFHPFKWAWIVYLFGLIFLVAPAIRTWKPSSRISWIFLICGFLLHAYGMALRGYLAGRPPVSNMYETVVWVPWGVLLFGFILYYAQKTKLILICGAAVAIFCLVLTDLAPSVLDASLTPLEPVLRSTFWLTTHVLIITISYAAFFLAGAIGDVLLFYYLKDEREYAREIASGCQAIYRAIQIGVVLLAAGTILGGIWADYSWGRFWGWDPKETWALISLLGYLAVLHGRLVGWVKNFQLSALAVVTFSLVIMSWYGVNFVLGAGLHSYGFGAGGVEYVTGFVVLHILYVAYVSTVRYSRTKKLTN